MNQPREPMNEYIEQLLKAVQKKENCDLSRAVIWLAEHAGVSERTVWYWRSNNVKLTGPKKKFLGKIAEELNK